MNKLSPELEQILVMGRVQGKRVRSGKAAGRRV